MFSKKYNHNNQQLDPADTGRTRICGTGSQLVPFLYSGISASGIKLQELRSRILHSSLPAILLSIFLCASAIVHAQIGIFVETDKKAIYIGDRLHLSLQVRIPENYPLGFVQTDSFPHFEIIEKTKIDTVSQPGATLLKQAIVLTSFDSGRWVIPSFTIKADDKIFSSDSIPVDVSYSPNGIPQEYHDIKDIIEVKGDINWLYWIGAALVLLLLVFVYFWWRRRKKNKKPEIRRYEHLSPYEEAMKLLDDLEKENLSSKEKYTRLTYIFRVFLHRKFQWNAFRKTTKGLLTELDKYNTAADLKTRLAQTLKLADLAKFARYQPDTGEDQLNINVIREAIKSLNSES